MQVLYNFSGMLKSGKQNPVLLDEYRFMVERKKLVDKDLYYHGEAQKMSGQGAILSWGGTKNKRERIWTVIGRAQKIGNKALYYQWEGAKNEKVTTPSARRSRKNN
jgi:hypothetical protein